MGVTFPLTKNFSGYKIPFPTLKEIHDVTGAQERHQFIILVIILYITAELLF